MYDERFFTEALLKLLKAPFPAFDAGTGKDLHIEEGDAGPAVNGFRKAMAGKYIVMTGYAGESGAAVFYEAKKEVLLKRYSPAYLEKYPLDPGWTEYKRAVKFFEENSLYHVCAGMGGVFGALYRMSKALKLGFRVDMKKIPIRQQTVEIMNTLEGNPYELYAAGVVLGVCEDADETLQALKALGLPAAVLGRLKEGKKKILIRGEEERYLERPRKYYILEEQ